ncbi:MAG: helix-turn-helix domain-containing protein, partial [Thermodesulfobacteriota bacterium]
GTLWAYHWPGNVRELENMIQRYTVFGNEEAIMEGLSNLIQEDFLQEKERQSFSKKEWPSLKRVRSDAVIEAESKVIRDALEFTHWNRKKAAMILNISYKALLYKIKKFDIGSRDEVCAEDGSILNPVWITDASILSSGRA